MLAAGVELTARFDLSLCLGSVSVAHVPLLNFELFLAGSFFVCERFGSLLVHQFRFLLRERCLQAVSAGGDGEAGKVRVWFFEVVIFGAELIEDSLSAADHEVDVFVIEFDGFE